MSIASDLLRGNTDTIILASLKEQDSYGYLINKEIMAKTDSQMELKDATLYSAFRRLEKDGLVSTYWGDEEVGARRRYYSITDKGREAYEQNKAEWLKAKQMIDSLLVYDRPEEEFTKNLNRNGSVANSDGKRGIECKTRLSQ